LTVADVSTDIDSITVQRHICPDITMP